MRGDAERVADMLEAAGKLAEQGAKGRDRFDHDEIVQLTLVHLVQIIGEAASRVSDDLPRAPHPHLVIGDRARRRISMGAGLQVDRAQLVA